MPQMPNPNPTQLHALALAGIAGELLETFDDLRLGLEVDVRGRIAVYAPLPNGGWSKRALAVPDYSAVQLISTNDRGGTAYVTPITNVDTKKKVIDIKLEVATS